MHKFDTDVLVVGGGPAGLAAAIAARQQGLRVIVAEAAASVVDKCCGEGLMPDGVAGSPSTWPKPSQMITSRPMRLPTAASPGPPG